jgi:glycosyltransferase involved in cell wall biosynthesis
MSKIAQIVCVYPPYKSGISTSALNTARVFSSAGQEVKTFTMADDGKNFPFQEKQLSRTKWAGDSNAEGEIVRFKAFPKFGNGGFLPQLFWCLKNFDVIYLHYPFFGAVEIVWFLKKFFWKNKVKLIIYFHMEPELSSPVLKILSLSSRLIAPSLFKQADSIVCASIDYAEASMPTRIFAVNKDKIREIPFSVDTERFKPADFVIPTEPKFAKVSRGTASSLLKLQPVLHSKSSGLRMTNIFNIIFVGGLDKAHYFKGVNILLEAVAKLPLLAKEGLREVKKDWQLTIVGSGDLQPQYENQARDLSIADKVVFAGNISEADLPKKYQSADCLVLPSINKGEAFGIALLEAMASGLPVIASDLPGVRGVFTAESGLKIKPGDAEDLAAKLKYLMDNPVKCSEMGIAARREAEEKYSFEKVNDRLIELLDD